MTKRLEDYIKELPNLFGRVKKIEKNAKGDSGEVSVSWANISDKPATFLPTVGTTATTAKAGNYQPSATEIAAAIEAMTPEQVTAVQTKLGIVIEP